MLLTNIEYNIMPNACLNHHTLALKGFVKVFKISNILDYVVSDTVGTILLIKRVKMQPVGRNGGSGHLNIQSLSTFM